jgi:hypothetical protein
VGGWSMDRHMQYLPENNSSMVIPCCSELCDYDIQHSYVSFVLVLELVLKLMLMLTME